jgi:hypothetical protein
MEKERELKSWLDEDEIYILKQKKVTSKIAEERGENKEEIEKIVLSAVLKVRRAMSKKGK